MAVFGLTGKDIARLRNLLKSFESGQLDTSGLPRTRRVIQGPHPIRRGKTDEEITEGGTATVSIWNNLSGTMEDSTENEEVFNWYPSTVAADTIVYIVYVDGRWEILTEACTA